MAIYMDSTSGHATPATHLSLFRRFKTSRTTGGEPGLARQLVFLPAVRNDNQPGLHKLWYPGIRDTSTWSKFGAHGEHRDVFLFSNLGAL